MIKETISRQQAQKFYDHIGHRYDWFEMYEGKAKMCGIESLQLEPGLRVLNIGVGTGKEQQHIDKKIQPGGIAFGLDISPVMMRLTQERIISPVLRADTRHVPMLAESIERVYAAYVLDMIALMDITGILSDFERILKPGGRITIISLTEGVDLSSNMIVSLWKTLYKVSPVVRGGCRPLQMEDALGQAGFTDITRQVIVQLAVPSEITTGQKKIKWMHTSNKTTRLNRRTTRRGKWTG